MRIEDKLKGMGIILPDLGASTYYGANYGKMRPFRRLGNLLMLSGHVPDLPDGQSLHPGRVGAEVTVEQAYTAARQTGINCLAGIRQAVSDLDKVVAAGPHLELRRLHTRVHRPQSWFQRSDGPVRRCVWSRLWRRLPCH
jgi:enamine deaminase RidA (YjgF/YER057c/UK114 family)